MFFIESNVIAMHDCLIVTGTSIFNDSVAVRQVQQVDTGHTMFMPFITRSTQSYLLNLQVNKLIPLMVEIGKIDFL